MATKKPKTKPPKGPTPIFLIYAGPKLRRPIEHAGSRWTLDPLRPVVVVDTDVWPTLQRHADIAAALAAGTLRPVTQVAAHAAEIRATSDRPFASPQAREMIA